MSVRVELDHAADYDGWRAAARGLAAARVPADGVVWTTPADPQSDLLASDDPPLPDSSAPPLSVPRAFLDLAEQVVCHRDADRFALLYGALLRLQSTPKLLADRADPDTTITHSVSYLTRAGTSRVEKAEGPVR